MASLAIRARGNPLYFCLALRGETAKSVDAVQALAEACLRFTPDLTVRAGEYPAIFLETSRCLALYSPDSLEARIRVLLREFGWAKEDFRLARASTLPKAWLCASHDVTEANLDCVPVTAIGGLIDPLGRHADEKRRVAAMIEVLFVLGIRNLGALRKLPRDSAVSRFGALYELLLAGLDGSSVAAAGANASTEFAWERFRPSEKFLERVDLPPDDPIWDLEPTLFQAKTLLDRLLKRAFGRGKALVAIELRIECERRRNAREVAIRIPLRFTFPQSSAPVVLRTLREKLAFEFERKPLEAPIAAYELEAGELAPRTGLQDAFLETGEPASVREGFRELVSELGTKLTLSQEVYQAELAPIWRPERSWRKTLKDASEVRGMALPIPERPLQMFAPPEPLRRLGRYFFWNERRYRIRKFAHVERLSGEWWEDDGGFTRTYYRVRVEPLGGEDAGDDREFWIFREQTNEAGEGGLYLHGIF